MLLVFSISIKGVVVREGKVLLLRNEREEWELPGGRIEIGETSEECVAREILEETRWEVDVGPVLDTWMYHIDALDKHVFIVTYGCHPIGDTRPVLSHEHRAIGLFSEDEISALTMPDGYRRSIARWYAMLRGEVHGDQQGRQLDTMSLIEVERKRELADGEALKARLVEADYREAGTSVEVDTYYSRPDIDFLATVECLRVRQRDGFAEMTYKPASTTDTHSAADIIAKPEINVVLSGPDQATAANTLLDVLGMVRLGRVEKTRTTFRHLHRDNVTVVIDLVTGVGAFVETEVIAADPDAAAMLLDRAERQLGLADCAVARLPYRDLVLQHEQGNVTA